jgi:sugar fermentation stimulation protein A
MLRFPSPIIEARFVRRYKRFFADFELADGSIVTAHCANPGSMKTLLVTGAVSWLTTNDNPKRKLRYTWQVVEVDGERVFVNPALANDVVVAAIREGTVPELSDYSLVEREVRISEESRIDLVLSGPAATCYVEVKNATMAARASVASFPDSVTVRGAKHLRELLRLAGEGKRALLFFCVSRERALTVEPADEIDPKYGSLLRQAVGAGVEVLAYGCAITPEGVRLARRVSLRLPQLGSGNG